MIKGAVAVLEVGSQKVTCAVSGRGVNDTFDIKSLAECDYEGFADGDFFDTDSLLNAVLTVVKEAAAGAKTQIDKLYVTVPAEFSVVRTRETSISFERKKRIKESDVFALHSKLTLSENSDFTVADVSAVFYILDDSRKVVNPVGQISTKLGGLLSYVLCEKYYYRLLKSVCKRAGVYDVEFIGECLAESLLLQKDHGQSGLLIDVGYLTASLSVLTGNGIVFLKSFSYGGGHICAALIDEFDIDIDVAEKLKRKINLGYDRSDFSSVYRIYRGEDSLEINIQKANAAVRTSLDILAEKIDDALKECADLPDNGVFALTGGGISFIRGGKEYLSTRIGYGLNVLAPRVPFTAKPDESVFYGAISLALDKSAGKIC